MTVEHLAEVDEGLGDDSIYLRRAALDDSGGNLRCGSWNRWRSRPPTGVGARPAACRPDHHLADWTPDDDDAEGLVTRGQVGERSGKAGGTARCAVSPAKRARP